MHNIFLFTFSQRPPDIAIVAAVVSRFTPCHQSHIHRIFSSSTEILMKSFTSWARYPHRPYPQRSLPPITSKHRGNGKRCQYKIQYTAEIQMSQLSEGRCATPHNVPLGIIRSVDGLATKTFSCITRSSAWLRPSDSQDKKEVFPEYFTFWKQDSRECCSADRNIPARIIIRRSSKKNPVLRTNGIPSFPSKAMIRQIRWCPLLFFKLIFFRVGWTRSSNAEIFRFILRSYLSDRNGHPRYFLQCNLYYPSTELRTDIV